MTENVTPKQARAIMTLLSEPTITAAAEKAGVTPKTIYQWLKQEAFTAELRRVQNREFDQVTARLSGGLGRALDELERLMTSAESEAVRRQAVSEWFNRTQQFIELRELEKRIQALEARSR
jgi:DNA-binding transcriptional MerR regulator